MTEKQQEVWTKYVGLGFSETEAMQLARNDPEWEDSELTKDKHGGNCYD